MSESIKQQIKAAMKRIVRRRPGRKKLVYDKATRTIIEVSKGRPPVTVLKVSDEEADMFLEAS